MRTIIIMLIAFIVGVTGGYLFSDRTVEPVSHDRIRCQVDEPVEGGESIDVPLATETEFKGLTVDVVYYPGDEYEPQSYFAMGISEPDGHSVRSVMYDYLPVEKIGPINVLSFEGVDGPVRFQCWIQS